MSSNSSKRFLGGLLLMSAVACFAAAGCADIRPEANDTGGGVLESETHEQDSMREEEQHHGGGGIQ